MKFNFPMHPAPRGPDYSRLVWVTPLVSMLCWMIILFALTGCSTNPDRLNALLDRLEFEEDEQGCVRLHGNVDLNPWPMVSTAATLDYRKVKGPEAPQC